MPHWRTQQDSNLWPLPSEPLSVLLRENRADNRSMPVRRLSKKVADAAEAKDKDYVIWDDELPGFGLRVFRSGKPS
jgi:hypothetical protein